MWMQLQKVRKDKNQKHLADAVDLKQVTISHVENSGTIPSPQAQNV